uniref:Uncharacterized protein n=1 Tax=Timema douglasi TaxID=61478 RepID=A0A7R8VJP1_TIMDO|nr:unnamed protein product [Timema douglasi]
MASLVLADSSQLTSDSQHLGNIMEHTPVPPPRLKKSKSQIQLIMAEPPKTAAFIPPKQYNCLKAPDELELILKCYQFGPISAEEKTIVSSSETNYTDLLHQENLDNIKLLIQTDNNGNNKNRKHPSLRGHEDSEEIDSGVDFGDGFLSRNNSATRVQNDIDRNKIIEEHEESYIRKTISYGQNPPSKYFIANSSESRNKSKPQGTIEEEEHTIDIKELVKGEGLEMYADTHISHSGGLCDANQIFQERDDLLLSTPKMCMRDSELLPNTEKLIQNLFMNDRNLDIHASSSVNVLHESNNDFTPDRDSNLDFPIVLQDKFYHNALVYCGSIVLDHAATEADISVQEDQPVDYSQCEYLILEDDPHILPGEYCVSLIKNWGSLGLQIEAESALRKQKERNKSDWYFEEFADEYLHGPAKDGVTTLEEAEEHLNDEESFLVKNELESVESTKENWDHEIEEAVKKEAKLCAHDSLP